ncbi:MAG: hypothetical protein WCL39_07410 [Armatimonadota bacterium]
MSRDEVLSRITNGAPGLYRIVVQGGLDQSWSDRLAGMRITTQADQTIPIVTVLEGRVNDQAELVGVLNSLYDLHMSILSVELQTDQ